MNNEDIQKLEIQVKEFLDRCSRIKQRLSQGKENKCNFAVTESPQNCY